MMSEDIGYWGVQLKVVGVLMVSGSPVHVDHENLHTLFDVCVGTVLAMIQPNESILSQTV